MYSVADLFCGAGGMGLGFKQAGFNLVDAVEFDKYAVKSYEHNVSKNVQLADISQTHWYDIEPSDVWTFGFPCQDLSVAGKQAGMIKGITRSGLFYEVMRLLEETRQCAPLRLPKIIMAENVKAVKKVLPEIEKEYRNVGYMMYYTLYNSKYWGVPQNRERYFIVGVRDDLPQTFEFATEQRDFVPVLSSILETDVPEKYYVSEEKAAKIIEQALKRISDLGTVHATLTPDRIDKRQNGRRSKENEEEMFTLTAQDLHGVIQSVYTTKDGCAYANNARYYKGASYADIGKSRNTMVIEPKTEVVGMLDMKAHEHNCRVYQPKGAVIRPTVTVVSGGTHHIKILDQYRVRRLTPREYARLQAFPDTYEFTVSDTQLYKQFGNAVTVTVAKSLAESIMAYLNQLTIDEEVAA